MIILGIDTALRCTGYGLVQLQPDRRLSALDCGVIRNSPKLSQSQCLARLNQGIAQLIDLYKPDEVAIEGIFFAKNARTAMILGMARGAAISAAATRALPCHEYSPSRAKQALTGSGQASKEQVAAVVSALLAIDPSRVLNDATDALALAIAHAHAQSHPLMAKLGKPI